MYVETHTQYRHQYGPKSVSIQKVSSFIEHPVIVMISRKLLLLFYIIALLCKIGKGTRVIFNWNFCLHNIHKQSQAIRDH